MLPLEKVKRAILPKYELNPFQGAALMNGMLLQDVGSVPAKG
jgi:hypothetical protein